MIALLSTAPSPSNPAYDERFSQLLAISRVQDISSKLNGTQANLKEVLTQGDPLP
jgi:hypothetical protein